ncbi:MAG: hypothetical protein WC969_01545 [Elusimicrobiota bacterium]|jgi:hypothetical protein
MPLPAFCRAALVVLLAALPALAGPVSEVPPLNPSVNPAGTGAVGVVGPAGAGSSLLLPAPGAGLTLTPSLLAAPAPAPKAAASSAQAAAVIPAASLETPPVLRGGKPAAAKVLPGVKAEPSSPAPVTVREQLEDVSRKTGAAVESLGEPGGGSDADAEKAGAQAGVLFDAGKTAEPLDEISAGNSAVFSSLAETYARDFHRTVQLQSPPAGYNEDLRARGGYRVLLKGPLSFTGSTGPVMRGELRVRGADGKTRSAEVAVKVFHQPRQHQTWEARLRLVREEVVAGRAMSAALPKGWAPRFIGEVDVDGNPAIAMELVRGKEPSELTPSQLLELLTPRAVEQAAAGIELLRRAGWGGKDSPQVMLLTEDQVLNGVQRRRGDVVFMDAGMLTRDADEWRTPKQKAEDLLFMYMYARELKARGLDKPIDDVATPLTRQETEALLTRAQAAAARYEHPDLAALGFAPTLPAQAPASPMDILGTLDPAKSAQPGAFRTLAERLLPLVAKPSGNALRGKEAYAHGRTDEIVHLQKAFKDGLLAGARAQLKLQGLKESEVVSHGTTLKGFLGMLLSGRIEATSSYRGMSGESAHVWGAYGAETGASYGGTRGVSQGQPGVVVLIHSAKDPVRVVHGDTLTRAPTPAEDFVAVVISDGERTVVLDREAVRALAASAEEWKTSSVAAAHKGNARPFFEWEKMRDRLEPDYFKGP